MLVIALFPFRGRAQNNTGEEDPEPRNFQTWQLLHMTVYDDATIRADMDISTRWFDDSTRLGVGYVNPLLYWKAQPWLDVGAGYFFAEVQPEEWDDYQWEQRLQILANVTQQPLSDWASFSSRNMFEWRFFEGTEDTIQRFRLRPQVTFFPKGWGWDLGPLEAFYINNEWFLTLEGAVYRENRLIPFGMIFRIEDNLSLNVFYMLRSDREADGHWEPTHVLGTYLCWKL